MTFRFTNLALRGDPAVLTRRSRSAPAFLTAVFGPQHLLEEAFFDAGAVPPAKLPLRNPPIPPDPDFAHPTAAGQPRSPVQARLSGASRIVVTVTGDIPYTEAGLLAALGQLPLSVAPHADAPTWKWLQPLDIGRLKSLVSLPGATPLPGAAAPGIVQAGIQSPLTVLAGLGKLAETTNALKLRFGDTAALASAASSVTASQLAATVPTVQLPVDRPPLRAPTATETALELPWRLLLSPTATGAFAHSGVPVDHGGRVELWHTRLGVRAGAAPDTGQEDVPRVNESDPTQRTVRAIWTRDFDQDPATFNPAGAPPAVIAPGSEVPFRASLDSRDRASIVHETSNFNLATNQGRAVGRLPTDVEVKTLMLTTMGGWLDCELDVANPPVAAGLTLEQWKHRATMGRDHYVKVVYAGYLYPFGHKASVIKVTERRVVSESGHATAFLFQRVYVLVRQELREFGAGGSPSQRSTMPLRWVRVLTRQTPPLTQPVPIQVQPPGASAKGLFFVPNVSPTDNGSNAGPAEAPFQFRMMAADAQDNVVEFSGPLIFIEADNLTDPKFAGDILTAADTKSPDFELRGQKIAYAPYRTTGDTALQTTSLTFDASWFHGGDDANFLPTLRKTKAVVPAMSAFTGQADPVALSYPPGFDLDDFKNPTKNPAQIFLATATSQVMNFSSQSDKSGGFLSPDVAITALSRINGPMGGDVTAMMKSTGAFDLSTFFGSSAKLFGIVSLAELLATIAKMDALPKFVTRAVDEATALLEDLNRIKSLLETQAKSAGDSAQDLANAVDGAATALLAFAHDPGDDALTNTAAKSLHDVSTPLAAVAGKIEKSEIPRAQRKQASALLRRVTGALNDAAGVMTMFSKLFNGLAHPSSVSASLDWSTTLESWPPAKDMDNPIFVPGGDRKLSLAAQIEAPLKGGAPTSLVSCSLPPFSLNLVGPVELISIHVKTMEFSVAPGKKPDVNVELEDNGIEFTGPLGFIETLKEIIPMDGFSDPPYLDISPAGINAGFDLALPDLAMGVFALSNISVGARLVVPFVGESLEFQFYFARRENPFRLAVALFAGGGFVGITLTPAGLKVIEAAFEFGAAAEVDFGVASGSVSVMAGIYFRLELAGSGQNITLTGYFRARGEVSVLALVSICIEIYLELSYLHESGCDKAVGQAVITLEVSICFLSFSVKLECERKFAGSKGDPSFAQVMSPYVDYRGDAFAPWDQYCNAFAPETV